MRPGHWIAIDCVIAAAPALIAAFAAMAAGAQARPVGLGGPGPPSLGRAPAGLLLALAVYFPVALRRRGPVPAFCVLVAVSVLGYLGAGQPVAIATLLAAAYVLYLVTVTTSKQTGGTALALALALIAASMITTYTTQGRSGDGAAIPIAFALVIAWIAGYSVRQRRLYADMLRRQAANSAVAEERLRIARELHDVIAHSMSVIAVQAGYGQYVIDTSPSDARDALGAIQATSRDALEEMRRMLGVLRQQDAMTHAALAPLAPAPGLANLGRLIDRTSGAGIRVALECSGAVRAVPAGIDLSAYRIIQEALTNVVKHAGDGAQCEVKLDYGGQAIDIRVTDDGGRPLVTAVAGGAARAGGAAITPASGTGHGIIGMRERVNLCGGEFSAGPLPDNGFQVSARLPLPADGTVGGPAT
jgi:signal transduction histidine kinase